MLKHNQSIKEKSCIALGGLEGTKFDAVLGRLQEELLDLKRFVADSCAENDVAPAPMTSVGHEVKRDAIILKHMETKLLDGMSQLITLLALTRSSSEAVKSATAN